MRIVSRVSIVVVAGLTLCGCLTGQRPTLTTAPPGGNEGSPVGDANADAVLTLLESTATDASTATYTILHRFGGETATAVVARDGTGKKAVTIGDIRFLLVGGATTCVVTTKECVSGVVEQRVSNLGVSSTFADNAPARRLRVSVRRKTAPTTASTRDVGGQRATCVTVPVGTGQETYCAVAGGHLAVLESSDLDIQLSGLTPGADPKLFAAP